MGGSSPPTAPVVMISYLVKPLDTTDFGAEQPGCALTLRRCWYEQYERRRPADKPSLHFDDAAVAAQDAFLNEHIRPHIAARERAGEFREWLAAIEGHAWEAEAPAPPEAAPSAVELANSDV